MDNLSSDTKKILQENADLIHLVILALSDSKFIPQLNANLEQAEKNGWTDLVASVRKIISGVRDIAEFPDLDNEDRTVINGILKGIEDPASLPAVENSVEPDKIGTTIANYVYETNAGNKDARNNLNILSAELISGPGDLKQIASVIGLLVQGERDKQVLCGNMGHTGIAIIESILEEMTRLES